MTASGDLMCPPYTVGQPFFSGRIGGISGALFFYDLLIVLAVDSISCEKYSKYHIMPLFLETFF